MQDKSIYLDFEKPLSYNALLSFIITERGLGKSYGGKKFVAKRFIKRKKQFVYLKAYFYFYCYLHKMFIKVRESWKG